MKNANPKIRLIWLLAVGLLMAGVGFTVHRLFNWPTDLRIDEVLWVKKGEVFHPPGSSVSNSVINLLHPAYIDFEEMTFTGPVLLLHDSLGARDDGTFSRSPLVFIPYDP